MNRMPPNRIPSATEVKQLERQDSMAKIRLPTETSVLNEYLQKRLYKTESSRLIVSQPSPLLRGLFAFQMARRYLISNIEKTTNLKKAAVAKALNNDSTYQEVTTIIRLCS